MLKVQALAPIYRFVLTTLLTVVLPFCALATPAVEEGGQWRALVPQQMRLLPESILKWYITETDYLSREVDPLKIASPRENSQDPLYRPEAKNVFELTGLWMPEEELRVYSSPASAELGGLQERFTRSRNGKREILFLIHPESLDLYKKWLKSGYEKETFQAAATSSSRSLLVWKRGQEQTPFIAKLSLNKIIAQVNRGVKGSEVAKSIGTSATLEGAGDLPKNFLFMRESFGAIPLGLERGGMILREFPAEMLDPKSHFLPLFALYGDQKPGFLLSALQRSKQSPARFVSEKIIAPFAKVWSELALKSGILLEPHAQNVLMEVRQGQLTGRFVFRDFGGFTIDFGFRKQRHLFVPENLPTFTGSVFDDYSLKYYAKNIRGSLAIFFEGGFLYNIEKSIRSWQDKGWLQGDTDRFETSPILKNEISKALTALSGRKPQLGDYFAGIDSFVLENRGVQITNHGRRIGFFSGTFDPPHEGHRDLIERSIRELQLDSIVVVTGMQQEHKPGASSFAVRDRLARAAFGDIPQVVFLNPFQLRALSQGGIPALQQKLAGDYVNATVFQIMGDDGLERLEGNASVRFPENFVLAVGKRDERSVLPSSFRGKTPIVGLSPDYRNYSSTRFRDQLARGEAPREIPRSVMQLIRELNLYRWNGGVAPQCHAALLL